MPVGMRPSAPPLERRRFIGPGCPGTAPAWRCSWLAYLRQRLDLIEERLLGRIEAEVVAARRVLGA